MKLGPYDLGYNGAESAGIYHADALEHAREIPDESVDLVFTDPVYDRMDHYRWLSETSERVLRPDSSCLVATSIPLIGDVINAMRGPLDFKWMLTCWMPGRRNLYYKIMNKYFAYLWFVKGNGWPRRVVFDMTSNRVWGTTLPAPPGVNRHPWQKPIDWIANYVDRFTDPGDVVWDPFTGGGSVPVVCKLLSRWYLATELDAERVELARSNVRETQPPLMVPAAAIQAELL